MCYVPPRSQSSNLAFDVHLLNAVELLQRAGRANLEKFGEEKFKEAVKKLHTRVQNEIKKESGHKTFSKYAGVTNNKIHRKILFNICRCYFVQGYNCGLQNFAYRT